MSLQELEIIAIQISQAEDALERNDCARILCLALKNYGKGRIDESQINYVSNNGFGTERLRTLVYHAQYVTNQDNILPDIVFTYENIYKYLDPIDYLDNDDNYQFYKERACLIDGKDTVPPGMFAGDTANPAIRYLSPFDTDYKNYMYNAPHGNTRL